MAKSAVEAELARYVAGERVADITKTMRELPANVDVTLAVAVATKLLERTFWFGRSCQKLPVPVIRALLATEIPGASHLFLRLAVPADADPVELARAWQRALAALLDLDLTYAWGSRQRRARFAALAKDAHMLRAIQGTVAHSKDVPLDMLAVLVADGSAESYDALVTHIDPAVVAGDTRLDWLARLRTHAVRTPALDALFAELDGELAKRNDASPALALGQVIGIGEVPMLWFDVRLGSRELNGNRVPRVQGDIGVDSRSQTWFRVWVSIIDNAYGGGKGTSFNSQGEHGRDDLGLGHCAPAELPAWLARAATALEIAWDPFVPRSHLRGAKRDRIAAWLSGAAAVAARPGRGRRPATARPRRR